MTSGTGLQQDKTVSNNTDTLKVSNTNKSGSTLSEESSKIRENFLQGSTETTNVVVAPSQSKQSFSVVKPNNSNITQPQSESTSFLGSIWEGVKSIGGYVSSAATFIGQTVTSGFTAVTNYFSSPATTSTSSTTQSTTSTQSSLTSGTLTSNPKQKEEQAKITEQRKLELAALEKQQATKVVLENGKPKIIGSKDSWSGWLLGAIPDESLMALAKQDQAGKDFKEGNYGRALYNTLSSTWNGVEGAFKMIEGVGSFLGLGEVIKGVKQLTMDTAKYGIKTVMSLCQGDLSGAWENIKGVGASLAYGVGNVLYGAASFLGLIHIGKGLKQFWYDAPKLLFEGFTAALKGDFETASAKYKEAGWTALSGMGNQLLGGIILGVNLLSFGYGGAVLNCVGRFTSRIGLGLAERFGVQLTEQFVSRLSGKVLGTALTEGVNLADKKLITLTLEKGQQLVVQGIKGVGEKEMVAFLKEAVERKGFDYLARAIKGGSPSLEKLALELSEDAGKYSLKFLKSYQSARAEEVVSKLLTLTDRGLTQRTWHRIAPTRFAKYIEKHFAKELGETITREQSLAIANELITKEGRALLSRLPKMTRVAGSQTEETLVQGITTYLKKEFTETGFAQLEKGFKRGIRVHLHDVIREEAIERGILRKATEQETREIVKQQGIEQGLIKENWRGKIEYLAQPGQSYKEAAAAYQQFEKKLLENPISKYTWNITKDDVVTRAGETYEAALKRTQAEFQKRYRDLSKEALENARPTVRSIEENVVSEFKIKAKELYKREALEETVRKAVRERLEKGRVRRIYSTSFSSNADETKLSEGLPNIKPNLEDVRARYSYRDDAEYWNRQRGKSLFEEIDDINKMVKGAVGTSENRNTALGQKKSSPDMMTESPIVSSSYKKDLKKAVTKERDAIYDKINSNSILTNLGDASRKLTEQSIQMPTNRVSKNSLKTGAVIRAADTYKEKSTNKVVSSQSTARTLSLQNQVDNSKKKLG